MDDKIGILDIRAKINNKINCNIEMQVTGKDEIEKRLLFYWSKMYNNTIKKGEEYEVLEKCIVILMADFEIKNLKEIEKYITKWNIREEENKQTILTDMLEIYIIEIPKYKKKKSKKELDKWLKFIENPEVINMQEENKAIVKAKKVLEEISQDERERYLAELREKYIMDQKATEQYGYKQGLEHGGNNKAKIIAKKMKDKKLDIDFISEITGLKKEEIEKL